MKYYLDLSVVGEIPHAYLKPSSEIMKISGLNLGNLAFRHALDEMFSNLSDYRLVTYPGIWESINAKEGIEEVIVSCANWLGVREADERSNKVRANTIEAIDAPVYSFGLGVQASPGADDVDLGPESVRLARALASKSDYLSVRDELTGRVLEKYGVGNTLVTGCPSNFINPDPMLGQQIIERAEREGKTKGNWSEVRTNISEFSGGHSASGKLLQRCFSLMKDTPALYVIQAPTLLPFIFGEDDEFPTAYAQNLTAPADEIRQVFRKSTLHFSSVPAWLDFSRTCDLATGMRIHGTMIPLQAGVPSLLIGHDSRTQGLAAVMNIPVVGPDEFLGAVDTGPQKLYELIEEKMVGYDSNRVLLGSRFSKMVERSELSLSEGFSDLHA